VFCDLLADLRSGQPLRHLTSILAPAPILAIGARRCGGVRPPVEPRLTPPG
jgi:hypothetical protein